MCCVVWWPRQKLHLSQNIPHPISHHDLCRSHASPKSFMMFLTCPSSLQPRHLGGSSILMLPFSMAGHLQHIGTHLANHHVRIDSSIHQIQNHYNQSLGHFQPIWKCHFQRIQCTVFQRCVGPGARSVRRRFRCVGPARRRLRMFVRKVISARKTIEKMEKDGDFD